VQAKVRPAQGWWRREACEARGVDFDASDGGARRRFVIGGVRNQNIYTYNVVNNQSALGVVVAFAWHYQISKLSFC
jgi:hypothetical protein